jgi:hypothetical protein
MPLIRTLTPKTNRNLDQDWVHLMQEARNLGISKEEVLQFIRQTQKQNREYQTNGS